MKVSFLSVVVCASAQFRASAAFSARAGHVARNAVLNMVSTVPGAGTTTVASSDEVRL